MMKAKPLITDDDFVVNPHNYSGSKIPRYYPCEGEHSSDHGSINYGVFRATEYVNRKTAPLLDALVTYFNSEDQDEKNTAFDILNEIAGRYK